VYMLIPNTKVKFINAFISGVAAGTGFLVLQWLFVSGTLYVTKYNAIYGSFAFLPLMLLWMQLAWVICLAGAVICYSSQNVFAFSLDSEVSSISPRYKSMVTIAIAAVIARRFVDNSKPATARDLMNIYDFPARLVTQITDTLCLCGVTNRVLLPGQKDVYGFQLATDPATLTVAALADRLYSMGSSDFIPDFNIRFKGIPPLFTKIEAAMSDSSGNVKVADIAPIQKDN
ncbi:MAG: YihY/virulence factor BrkB family protein, partial [Muribaculaceae bacterium]|nr:YihY/virulence factor BrkB family protein [Muribaculaceae bacterium]